MLKYLFYLVILILNMANDINMGLENYNFFNNVMFLVNLVVATIIWAKFLWKFGVKLNEKFHFKNIYFFVITIILEFVVLYSVAYMIVNVYIKILFIILGIFFIFATLFGLVLCVIKIHEIIIPIGLITISFISLKKWQIIALLSAMVVNVILNISELKIMLLKIGINLKREKIVEKKLSNKLSLYKVMINIYIFVLFVVKSFTLTEFYTPLFIRFNLLTYEGIKNKIMKCFLKNLLLSLDTTLFTLFVMALIISIPRKNKKRLKDYVLNILQKIQ